jgi:hypothetical protein
MIDKIKSFFQMTSHIVATNGKYCLAARIIHAAK